MFVKACTATTQVFSVESIFSALRRLKQYITFKRIYWTYKIKSGLKTHVINLGIKLKKTLTREVSSEIYIPQSFKR